MSHCDIDNNSEDDKIIDRVDFLSKFCVGRGIDVGCGRHKCKGSIGVDIDADVKPDIVAAADDLPFKDGELDFVVSSHCLEHLLDTKKALKEWDRVLRPRGIIAILVPDSDLKRGTILEPMHKVAFTKNNLRQLIGVYLWYDLIKCVNSNKNVKHNKNKSDILCVGKKRFTRDSD